MKKIMLSTLVFCFITVVGMAHAFGADGSPVKFSLSTGMDFTDNRDSTDAGEESNVDIQLTPKVAVDLDLGSILLEFYCAPTYRYRTNPREGSQNESELYVDLNARAELRLKRLKLAVSDHFALTDDPAVQNKNGQRREDASYAMNRVGIDGSYSVTKRTSIDAGLYNMIKQYSEPSRDASDEQSVDARVSFWRQMAKTWGLLGSGTVQSFGYGSTNRVDRDFTAVGLGIGGELVISKRLRGSIRHGWKLLNYSDSSFSSSVSPYVDVSVKATVAKRLTVSGGVAYEMRESDVYPYASQKFSDIYANAAVDVGRMWRVGIHSRYRQGNYDADQASAAASVAAPGGTERGVTMGVEGTLKISKQASLKITQNYENVNSDVRNSFVKNSVDLSFSLQF